MIGQETRIPSGVVQNLLQPDRKSGQGVIGASVAREQGAKSVFALESGVGVADNRETVIEETVTEQTVQILSGQMFRRYFHKAGDRACAQSQGRHCFHGLFDGSAACFGNMNEKNPFSRCLDEWQTTLRFPVFTG